jgi:hypothetical protein
LPPIHNRHLRGLQNRFGRQPLPLLFLVHRRVRWKQIPQIAARPSRPGEAVVDVERRCFQLLPAPDAVQRLSGLKQAQSNGAGEGNVARRLGLGHGGGKCALGEDPILPHGVVTHEAHPLGD